MKKIFLPLIILMVLSNGLYAQTTKNITTNVSNSTIPLQNDITYPIIIKLSHSDKANSIKGKSAIRFKEMLEAKFPKKIKVELYENSTLYKPNEEIEAVELGVVNLIIPPTDKLGDFKNINELQLFDLPFLFSSNNDLRKVMTGQSGKDLLSLVNDKINSLQAIGYLSEGYRVFAGDQFYKNPNDFKNKIISVSSLGINKLTYTNFNAKNIIKVFPSENQYIFNPLNKKADIAELSLTDFKDYNINEKLKYITESQHNYATDIVIVNKKWFNTLPDDIKKGMMDVMKDTMQYNLDLVDKYNAETKATLEKAGVKFYQWSEQEKEVFKKSVIPVHTNFLNEINKRLLLEAYQEIKNQ